MAWPAVSPCSLAHHPWLGLWLALAIGLTAGIAQGFIIVRLHLSSVGVTLGGLLVFVGIAFVLTESRSLPTIISPSPSCSTSGSANLLHSQRGPLASSSARR
jgi:ribose/xylose/arabinose/galactoside ABC-type transport system permease subunit